VSDWKKELKELLERTPEERKVRPEGPTRIRGFISDIVVPAFEEIAEELQEYGRDVEVEYGDRTASIRVVKDGKEEFYYEVRIKAYQKLRFAFPIAPLRDAEGKTYRAEIHLRDRALLHDVTNATKEEMIQYFLRYYARHLTWEG